MYTLEKSIMKKFSYYRFSRWRGREPGTIIRPLQVCHEGSELYGYSNSVRDEITQIPWHKVADIRHSRARAGEALPRILSILEIPKKIGCVHGEVEEIVAHVSRDRAYTSPIRRIKSFHRSIEIFIPRKKDIITEKTTCRITTWKENNRENYYWNRTIYVREWEKFQFILTNMILR